MTRFCKVALRVVFKVVTHVLVIPFLVLLGIAVLIHGVTEWIPQFLGYLGRRFEAFYRWVHTD